MQIAGLIIGIIAILFFVIGLFPCLGAINWVNIPIAFIGLIISIIAMSQAKPEENKSQALIGLILCIIAIVIGLFRLILGGGVL